jgi:hypothetical protein
MLSSNHVLYRKESRLWGVPEDDTLSRPVSSPSTPSVSSTTLAKLLALDEEREKSFNTSALWAAVSTLFLVVGISGEL